MKEDELHSFIENDNRIRSKLLALRDAQNIYLYPEVFIEAGMFKSIEQAKQYVYALLDSMLESTTR